LLPASIRSCLQDFGSINRRINAARKALKREAAAECRLHFSHRRVRVILASLIACHFEEALLLEILVALRSRQKRSALQNADLLAALNRWFAALSEPVLSQLVNPEPLKQKRVC